MTDAATGCSGALATSNYQLIDLASVRAADCERAAHSSTSMMGLRGWVAADLASARSFKLGVRREQQGCSSRGLRTMARRASN